MSTVVPGRINLLTCSIDEMISFFFCDKNKFILPVIGNIYRPNFLTLPLVDILKGDFIDSKLKRYNFESNVTTMDPTIISLQTPVYQMIGHVDKLLCEYYLFDYTVEKLSSAQNVNPPIFIQRQKVTISRNNNQPSLLQHILKPCYLLDHPLISIDSTGSINVE